MESRAFIVGLIVGILATVTMDVVAVIALRFGIAGWGPRRTGPDLIGRWIGYLLRGKFRHTDILQTPPLRGELMLGLATHYTPNHALQTDAGQRTTATNWLTYTSTDFVTYVFSLDVVAHSSRCVQPATANTKGQTSKNWRSILVSILWTRLTLENWRAKLVSLLLAVAVSYLIKKM